MKTDLSGMRRADSDGNVSSANSMEFHLMQSAIRSQYDRVTEQSLQPRTCVDCICCRLSIASSTCILCNGPGFFQLLISPLHALTPFIILSPRASEPQTDHLKGSVHRATRALGGFSHNLSQRSDQCWVSLTANSSPLL